MAGSDDKRKPKGVFASDDDRALAGSEARKERQRVDTPAAGVPIHAPEPDDFTPVGDVLQLLDHEALRPHPELRDVLRNVVQGVWRHTANEGMRTRLRYRSSETGVLREEIDEIEARTNTLVERVTDLSGKSGDNGKLGELRRRVDAWTSKMWWFVTALVGALGTAAVKLVFVTRAFDAVEARSIHNQALIERQHNDITLLRAEVMAERAARISRRRSPTDDRALETTTEPATPEKD